MKNTLGDLNNHLFKELVRLSDEGLTGEDMQEEIMRAKSVTDIAKTIIENARTVLSAEKFKSETLGRSKVDSSKILEG